MRRERLLSPLAHVELLTTDLEKSVDFARDILGLDVVEQVGDTVYLRCWGDYYLYSLVLTASDGLGLGHASWRAEGPEQLSEAVRRVEASGTEGTWIEDSFGHGRAYRFVGPAGHQHELFWEVERAVAPAGEESCYPERPQRTQARGIGVRILDHLTVTAPDVRDAAMWLHEQMGSRIMAAVELKPGAPWMFAVTTNNEKAHDLGLALDFDGQRGRLNHLAFWVETNHDLTAGAKFIIEHGHTIDMGPGQHGIGEQDYLYFRDPVGLRYELNSGGYRNYVPDWEPVIWSPTQGSADAYLTEISMPAVAMVNIPPGVAGSIRELLDTTADTAEAALAQS
jgi:catechol 2,3-dioxygenase